MRYLKYFLPLLLMLAGIRSFYLQGIVIWYPLIAIWIIVPLLELFLKPDDSNLSEVEESAEKQNKVYDLWLYMIVPLQYFALYSFLKGLAEDSLTTTDYWGRILVMGLLCGVFGINVAHELGHRSDKTEQALAKILLLTSLYMHFFIEHNKGHHKRVATENDPNSARYNEPVYLFYLRSITQGYLDAWKIAGAEVKRKGIHFLSLRNEMIQFTLIQLGFLLLIYTLFGLKALGAFCVAALIGILLLESVNYIQHYGLQRKKNEAGQYEKILPHHSWNSNHIIGRLILFELTRHSDHHYKASRKYQILRHHENSPQMPTGYPGMILLALIPPIWFSVMNNRIRKLLV
ncbi:MAG: alkane 1-monooxygenase [Chitinophagaceae bacterium]|nr:alkane 1-monooxygenase [Chitinophagaceae bacterium]